MTPIETLNSYYEAIKKGTIKSMEGLLTLFTLAGEPLTLKQREPMVPVFSLNRPKRMTLLTGRQVSKSFTIAELCAMLTGFTRGFTSAVVEPRFIQKKRFNSQILAPLLRDCLVRDLIIDKKNTDNLDIKQFKAGGQVILLNGYLSPDSGRGISGASLCVIDECVRGSEALNIYDTASKTWKNKEISQILAGDLLQSFGNSGIIYSVAVRDASYRGIRPCYCVKTASGRSITVTSGHLLPTNIGKKRLEEIVEYVKRVSEGQSRPETSGGDHRRGEGSPHDGGAIQCDTGFPVGRRLSDENKQRLEPGIYIEVEPLHKTEGVRIPQIPVIERVRYKRTSDEAESRLRRLLSSAKPECYKAVSLIVSGNASRLGWNQKGYPDILKPDNAPYSSSLVVHGRRLENENGECRKYSYERLFEGGCRASSGVDEIQVVDDSQCLGSKALKHREIGKYYSVAEGRFPEVDRFDQGNDTREYAVQVQDTDTRMRGVRKYDAEEPQSLLLSGMCENFERGDEEGVSRDAQRGDKRKEQELEIREQRESSRDGEEVLRESVSGAPCGSHGVLKDLEKSAQRRDKCEKEGEKTRVARRSGIQGNKEEGRSPLLGEVKARPGENGGEKRESKGSRTAKKTRSRVCEEKGGEGAPQKREVKARPGENGGEKREGERAPEAKESQQDRGRETCRVFEDAEKICKKDGAVESGPCGKREILGAVQEVLEKGTERSCETCKAVGEEKTAQRDACKRARHSLQTKKTEGTCRDRDRLYTAGDIRPYLVITDTYHDADYFYDPIASIEYVGDEPVYDIEVVGTHNFILANGICSYNCQDIPNSFIPVFESMTDAMVDTGFRIRSGTAKTSDGSLSMSFEESSQGHWCIKCSCGKYNIAAPDQQLFQMIGRHGCSCAYCGRVLDVTTGYYVFKYPSRVYTHIGYHMPQIIFDFHNTKGGWGEILYKKNNWGKTEFLNEVLGVPDDDSVRLLSKGDLLKARNNIRDKATAVSLKSNYDMCVLGVDWGGGGGGDSATGIAVIAKNNNARYFECLYMNRLPQGLTPEQEADAVASLANEFEVDYIAHDYTGAGFVRESLFISKHPGWQPYMYPVSYTYKPTSDLVTVSTSGSRTSYTVDKTKSLLLTINCIKYGALFLPWFDEKDPNAVQLDFLAIIEHHQSLKEDAGGKNTVLRSSEVYLLDKVAGKKDDAAQAVNIGLIAACNIIGYYPVFTFDSKYDMTPEKYEMLTGEKS